MGSDLVVLGRSLIPRLPNQPSPRRWGFGFHGESLHSSTPHSFIIVIRAATPLLPPCSHPYRDAHPSPFDLISFLFHMLVWLARDIAVPTAVARVGVGDVYSLQNDVVHIQIQAMTLPWCSATVRFQGRIGDPDDENEHPSGEPKDAGDYGRSMLQFFYWATPPMMKIPYRMVLDVLLESLGLPVAEYRTKACEGGLKL